MISLNHNNIKKTNKQRPHKKNRPPNLKKTTKEENKQPK
jgi:hypothetical protein